MVWKLVLYLIAHNVLAASEAPALYRDAIEVASTEEPLFEEEFGRYKTLLLLIEWTSRESAGYKHVIGKAGDCGRGQLLFLPARQGHSCDELRAAGSLDLQLTLSWMQKMRATCAGSLVRGLAAYARGSCNSEEGLKIAKARLEEIKKALSE